jgi:uncharacterized protein (DUF3084 family)
MASMKTELKAYETEVKKQQAELADAKRKFEVEKKLHAQEQAQALLSFNEMKTELQTQKEQVQKREQELNTKSKEINEKKQALAALFK